MDDLKLLNARKKLEESPNLTDEEYRKKLSYMNDEELIDDLNFDEKGYDILDCIAYE